MAGKYQGNWKRFPWQSHGYAILMVLPWVITYGIVLDNSVGKAVSNLTHGFFLGNELPTRQIAMDPCRG
jgi:hypothetical protein